MKYVKIPSKVQVAGQTFTINQVERCDGNTLGKCYSGETKIEIAQKFNHNDIASEDCKINTFWHELTHAILANMGSDLNDDEQFVFCFSGFLCEAMKNCWFKEEENDN